jgi:multidrug efflux pump subunit AcrA (membrane-fusion protein)
MRHPREPSFDYISLVNFLTVSVFQSCILYKCISFNFCGVVEEDLQMVKTGQSAQLYFDALPELNLTGHLARIVPQRTSDSHVLYPVYITLDEVPDRLAPGMTVDASITISKKEDVLRLPRTLVHARSDGTAELSVWDGVQVVKRLVKVGLRGDSYVEILSGVEECDQVVSR